jgi:hypothetical protein
MRKHIMTKLSMGVAAVAALTLANTPAVFAQGTLGETVSHMEAGVALVMPFDTTDGHESFQIVSRIGGDSTIVAEATHWSFWSDSCQHLGDVFICLTDNDTVVVDPRIVSGQIQVNNENINLGELKFPNKRGFITVSSFEADPDAQTCKPLDATTLSADPSLVGSWVIADPKTNAAFGNNAIAILDGETLPDTTTYFSDTSGLAFQFFNPDTLTDSEVMVIGIASPAGHLEFSDVEIGPIPSFLDSTLDGTKVSMCCQAEYFDNIETRNSLPDLCFRCSAFSSLTEKLAATDGKFLIPDDLAPHTSGFLNLANCVTAEFDGDTVLLADSGNITVNSVGDTVDIFPFAFHGMAVGPFGTAVSGKYQDVSVD